MAPIAEAIFLHNLSMWKCHVRFSSMLTPSDFAQEACSIGRPSMESSSVSDRVLNLCMESILHKLRLCSVYDKSVRHKPFA